MQCTAMLPLFLSRCWKTLTTSLCNYFRLGTEFTPCFYDVFSARGQIIVFIPSLEMIKVKTEENTLPPWELSGEVLLQAMEVLSDEAPQLP